MPRMVELWRSWWAESSGTDPLAPFGVVSLAGGGSEGHGQHMAALRWTRILNTGGP